MMNGVLRAACLSLMCLSAAGAMADQATSAAAAIDAALSGDHRDTGNAARDRYRHPKETLLFFGLEPDMTVVEMWPARGWYTEILAPVLKDEGQLYLADFASTDLEFPPYRRQVRDNLRAKLTDRPDIYAKVVLTELGPPGSFDIAPPGSADLVLTFRNAHNWLKHGYLDKAFAAAYRALKPGGVLGVVDHRAPPGTDRETMDKSGYVTEAVVIDAAESAGFRLEARSEINANSRDTADHPRGVWTLPPSLALKDQDREKYLAIGESDRLTLRFAKPLD